MIVKYIVPLLALAGLIFAVQTVAAGSKPVAVAPPIAAPSPSPYEITIAGAGIVEARSQNIAVGSPIAGVVVDVPVKVGDVVKQGTPLFRLDDRDRRALRDIQKAALDAAAVELARLEAQPRREDIPPATARVNAAAAELADARRQLDVAERLDDKRAMSVEEWNRRKAAVETFTARAAESKAELAKLESGAWAPDLAVARSKVGSAEALLRAADVDLERLVVRAPVDCTVLQVNVRPGEFAPSGAPATPLVLVGDLSALHVRVDIDENDAWRLSPGTPARAFVRGNSQLGTELEFVRVEPYVVPKRSLTGESNERVDTRVLQVIYRFDPKSLKVYVGQQMDVFIETTRVQDASQHSETPSEGPR